MFRDHGLAAGQYRQIIREILPKVEKPTRYQGNELNAVHKDPGSVEIKIALAFPDLYEVGMSHLGLKILYHIINGRKDALAERAYAPWVDMEQRLREKGVPLFSMESWTPLRDFEILGFTLQYEMSYTNILNMLDLAGIPLRSGQRGDRDPLVIAGGPCAFNPEPLAAFVDLFVIGDAEEAIHEVLDTYKIWRGRGRRALLSALARIPGVYVPSLFEVEYTAKGLIQGWRPGEEDLPFPVRKRVVPDLDLAPYPDTFPVPYMDIVHDRAMVEVLRGCTRGCRFCQAGMIYRPVRERRPETVKKLVRSLLDHTGYEELSLTSLSSSDYTCIQQVIGDLMLQLEPEGVALSLPSLRVDSFAVGLADQIQRVRRTSLTFAPEAGTQRLRDVINKGVTGEDLLETVRAVFGAGWSSVKLYFMIGLPTETEADLQGIVDLAYAVLKEGRSARRHGAKVARERDGHGLPMPGRISVTVSASSFVPKPHTPFQWEPQAGLETLVERQEFLKERLRDRAIAFQWHDARLSQMEAVLSRGDRRVGEALERAWQLGCRFDGWADHFHYDRWLQAFADTGFSIDFYAHRERTFKERLPWEVVDAGVTRQYLWRERTRALAGERTADCRFGPCPGCGVCPRLGVDTRLAGPAFTGQAGG